MSCTHTLHFFPCSTGYRILARDAKVRYPRSFVTHLNPWYISRRRSLTFLAMAIVIEPVRSGQQRKPEPSRRSESSKEAAKEDTCKFHQKSKRGSPWEWGKPLTKRSTPRRVTSSVNRALAWRSFRGSQVPERHSFRRNSATLPRSSSRLCVFGLSTK